jgi:chromosome segregation ATPase
MDTVTAVKKRVADLATHLEDSRSAIVQLQRERFHLLRQLEDAKNQVLATEERLLEDIRKREAIHDERGALIHRLDSDRKQLLRNLHSTNAQLGLTEKGVETLTRQLEDVERTKEDALHELTEATWALSEIRDQLRSLCLASEGRSELADEEG